jgi:glycosyltransferase involved in cell wall biosynthesis
VITTHVRPVHVVDAVRSLRAETHADLEMILVNDSVVDAEGKGEFRVDTGADLRIVRSDQPGVANARNAGMAEARGEFIIFLDDDDVALPHRIATLLRAARMSGATLCFGMTRRVAANSALALDAVPTRLGVSGVAGFCDLLTCNPHINAVLVRTEALRSVGGFDLEASHFDDWSAWLRIADRDAVVNRVSDVVAEWRVHEHGLSAQLLTIRAMKARLLALFARLQPSLSPVNARAVAMASRVVTANEILTYDDYVAAMASQREALHRAGECLGRRIDAHHAAMTSSERPLPANG